MADRLHDNTEDLAEARALLLRPPPKGKGKGVPQLGDLDGPLLVDSGWCKGYTLWIGDLPRAIHKVDIGKMCIGFLDVSV